MLEKFLQWAKDKYEIHLFKKRVLSVKKHQVWLANLGVNIGSEQNKLRPVVILNNISSKLLNTVIIAPVSSVKNKEKIESVLNCPIFSHVSGIKKDSVCLIHQIRCVDKKRLVKEIGYLSKEEKDSIEEALKKMLFRN